MAKNLVKVTLDTNILISALGFGGKPREILYLVLDKKIKAITSPILLAELEDVVAKKFPLLAYDQINKQIKKNFKVVTSFALSCHFERTSERGNLFGIASSLKLLAMTEAKG